MTTCTSFPVTVQSRIQKLLQLLQFQLSKFRLHPQYLATFSEPLLFSTEAHLKSLYEELIAPIRDLLHARTPGICAARVAALRSFSRTT